MQECPTPIVILSSLGNSNINPIMECLQLGAFDYLNKPNRNNARLRDIDAAIVNKVKLASAVDLKKLTDAKRSFNLNPHTFAEQLPYDIIAIGSSTGGPSALEQIIGKLPSNLALPVIIVQHMPENFVPSFALRLDALTPLEVRVGARNMVIEPGKIIVAPGDRNMIVKKQNGTVKVDFTRRSFREYNNPSVTGLMNSVAEVYKGKAIGVILTGMGKDGVEGMQAIKKAGGVTIAQNRETSVVFGMPGEAIARGCIDHVVPIHDMGGFLISCLS